jgi:hypothetical protein
VSPAARWPTPDRRLSAVVVLCALVGGGCAYLLHQALLPTLRKAAPAPFRLAVTIRAPVPASAVSPPTVRPSTEPVATLNAPPPHKTAPALLLLPYEKSAPEKSTEKAPRQEALEAPSIEIPEEVLRSTLPTLSQPSLGLSQPPELAALPALPSLGVPPSPVEDPFATAVFQDKPGGDIVVLGVLLNDRGFVLDSKILVPSRYTLGDMTVLYAGREQQWKDLVPPLMPGEQRWIEQRIDQRALNTPSTTVLP